MIKSLKSFLKNYERCTNTHDFKNLRSLIATDASYWFSEANYQGIRAIEKAFVSTWKRIKNEKYTILSIRWLVITPSVAVCTYTFKWKGVVGGKSRSGKGKGTNVLVQKRGKWQIKHEHLSSI
jgi:ketosteroid isomerase-like protein